MSTAALGATYSPSSDTELHYDDAISSVYPNRPIRPLPKRRLRSRLSPEVADSILNPQSQTLSGPLFQTLGPGVTNSHNEPSEQELEEEHDRNIRGDGSRYTFTANDDDSDYEDGAATTSYLDRRQQTMSSNFRNGYVVPSHNSASRFAKPPMPQSTASSAESVDGYDSFENTNNKKKRKIPTSGSLGNHHSTLSADMAHMGISSTRDVEVSRSELDGGTLQYHGNGNSAVPASSSGTGISGAGRGRYGRAGARHSSGRSPLGVSFNGPNALQPNRNLYHRRDYGSGSIGSNDASSTKRPDQGIISAAIANAANSPTTPVHGKENVSLLEQQSTGKPNSVKTQFTFEDPSGFVYPETSRPYQEKLPHAVGPQIGQNNTGFSTQGTQTSPNILNQPNQQNTQQTNTNQRPPLQSKKSRRPLRKQLDTAARERRLQQEYTNYHHPPKREDVWLCEFCEYEAQFGHPPRELIKQYELKDRRERRRVAEKRRLLEKAKMKGRKGKKGNKNNKSSNAATQRQHPNQKQPREHTPGREREMHTQGTQSEEYTLDDYDEDPNDSIPIPSPAPQTPSKIPQPVAYGHGQSLRPAAGSGNARVAGRAA